MTYCPQQTPDDRTTLWAVLQNWNAQAYPSGNRSVQIRIEACRNWITEDPFPAQEAFVVSDTTTVDLDNTPEIKKGPDACKDNFWVFDNVVNGNVCGTVDLRTRVRRKVGSYPDIYVSGFSDPVVTKCDRNYATISETTYLVSGESLPNAGMVVDESDAFSDDTFWYKLPWNSAAQDAKGQPVYADGTRLLYFIAKSGKSDTRAGAMLTLKNQGKLTVKVREAGTTPEKLLTGLTVQAIRTLPDPDHPGQNLVDTYEGYGTFTLYPGDYTINVYDEDDDTCVIGSTSVTMQPGQDAEVTIDVRNKLCKIIDPGNNEKWDIACFQGVNIRARSTPCNPLQRVKVLVNGAYVGDAGAGNNDTYSYGLGMTQGGQYSIKAVMALANGDTLESETVTIQGFNLAVTYTVDPTIPAGSKGLFCEWLGPTGNKVGETSGILWEAIKSGVDEEVPVVPSLIDIINSKLDDEAIPDMASGLGVYYNEFWNIQHHYFLNGFQELHIMERWRPMAAIGRRSSTRRAPG